MLCKKMFKKHEQSQLKKKKTSQKVWPANKTKCFKTQIQTKAELKKTP